MIAPRCERAVDEAVDAGAAVRTRVPRRAADGTARWVLERGQLVRGQDGRSWLDGVIFDITERRRCRGGPAPARGRAGADGGAARLARRGSSTRPTRPAGASSATARRRAQQRLVTSRSGCGAHAARSPTIRAQPAASSTRRSSELGAAIADLRNLARGIHPAVLSDHGLAPALRSWRRARPLPVELDVHDGRLPAAVESALYFVVAEVLTNVAKYAEATYASVRVVRDGVARAARGGRRRHRRGGGQRRSRGSAGWPTGSRRSTDGCRSSSPPGEGTTVRAKIPVHADPPADSEQELA